MGRLDGKVALVTGAGRGIGRSHCIRLAEEGADIIAVDLCRPVQSVSYPGSTGDDLEETAKYVAEFGGRVVTARADVRDVGALRRAVDDGVAELGRLDIVVANAGILNMTPLTETDDGWQDVIDVNVTGTWHTCKVTIPHLVDGGRGGSITLMSSIMGLKGFPGVAAYVTSKHAVVGLMRTLAAELAPHWIRVNTVHPTQVDTPMIMNEPTFRILRPDLEHPTKQQAAEVWQTLNALPLPWVEPIDISNVLVFLASDEARYITGVTLPVDAGCTIK